MQTSRFVILIYRRSRATSVPISKRFFPAGKKQEADMKTHSGNTLLTLLALVLLEATLAAQQTTPPAQPESTDATTTSAASPLSIPVLAASQARIVRLSDIQGTVQIDRNTGH